MVVCGDLVLGNYPQHWKIDDALKILGFSLGRSEAFFEENKPDTQTTAQKAPKENDFPTVGSKRALWQVRRVQYPELFPFLPLLQIFRNLGIEPFVKEALIISLRHLIVPVK